MSDSPSLMASGKPLGGGHFFGAVRGRVENSGALFTDLRHSIPRQLPCHSHELPFFGLLLAGQYGERYGRDSKQFGPFSIMYRPAGIPHQDEIGPQGVRLVWLGLQLLRATFGVAKPDELCVEVCLPKLSGWLLGCRSKTNATGRPGSHESSKNCKRSIVAVSHWRN